MGFETLIIGGGVIGLSLARELYRLGQRRIAVVDRRQIGREASWAAAGMLVPNAENETIDDLYRFCDESRTLFPELAEGLLAETGIDIELDRSGTLYAAFTEEDSEHLRTRYAHQLEAEIPVERLSAEETLHEEPNLAPNVRESLYFPNDWQVENRKLVNALQEHAVRNGIELIESTAVDSLIVEGSRVSGARVGGRAIYADSTVLATGAWTSLIKIGSDAVPFEVKPVRGQIISFAPSDRLLRHVIYSPRGYLVPRADGRVLAGATVEDVGFDKGITCEAVEALTATAVEIAPYLNNVAIAETWAGLRPRVADGLPVIGAIPGYDNLFTATAHFRNGILLAPVTAKVLAERMINGSQSQYLDLFGPRRFSVKGINANA